MANTNMYKQVKLFWAASVHMYVRMRIFLSMYDGSEPIDGQMGLTCLDLFVTFALLLLRARS